MKMLSAGNRMAIDYVVPTYNSAHTLNECLTAIRKYGTPGDIIIIDKYSSDETIDIAESHGCKVIQTDAPLGECRVIGAENAETEWIGFVDSDVIIDEKWNDMVKYCSDPSTGAIQVRNIYKPQDRPYCLCSNILSPKFERAFTGETLIRRELVLDADIRDCQAFEDWFLSQHVVRQGYKWLIVPVEPRAHYHIATYDKRGEKIMWHSQALLRYFRIGKINSTTFCAFSLRHIMGNLRNGDIKSSYYFFVGFFKPEYFAMKRG
jgi:glycosyltransferase involved in cell wall biosynthesis